MVGNYVHRLRSAFQVMTPDFESFKDGKKLLVMDVVVQLRCGEGTRVEGDGMDFP